MSDPASCPVCHSGTGDAAFCPRCRFDLEEYAYASQRKKPDLVERHNQRWQAARAPHPIPGKEAGDPPAAEPPAMATAIGEYRTLLDFMWRDHILEDAEFQYLEEHARDRQLDRTATEAIECEILGVTLREARYRHEVRGLLTQGRDLLASASIEHLDAFRDRIGLTVAQAHVIELAELRLHHAARPAAPATPVRNQRLRGMPRPKRGSVVSLEAGTADPLGYFEGHSTGLLAPDHALIRRWAESLNMEPAEVLRRLADVRIEQEDEEDAITLTLEDGALISLAINFETLPLTELNWVEGLRLRRLGLQGLGGIPPLPSALPHNKR